MTESVPSLDGVALRKAQLIQEALETLRASQQIDERDDLGPASFIEWYDRTIPDVRDIKILAGAMEIEMARRRGERIKDEGERRGRPEKDSQREALSKPVKLQRGRDRVLVEQPEAVAAFVQREVNAGRVPTVTGAVRSATGARLSAAPQRRMKQAEAFQARKSEIDEHVCAAITKLADGIRRTDDQVAKLTDYQTASFLQRIRLIPWLRIDRTPEGLFFQIDETLRGICEGRLPRPELSYQSIDQFLRHLRTEITRKRKENRDEREKTRWDSRLILTRVQSDLLDWIEQQLDQVPTL